MRLLLLIGIFWAQALPDSIFFYGREGETLRTVCRTFPSGWTAEVSLRHEGSWRRLRRDTFEIDSLRRLTRYIRYTTHAGELRPDRRWQLSYPLPQLGIFTVEIYDGERETFRPLRRLYLWGAPNRWDSTLMGWLALLESGWNYARGDPVLPYPVFSEEKLWGDSLLIEDFLPAEGVFVATGGYIRRRGLPCDTLPLFSQRGIQRFITGYAYLCKDAGGQLTQTTDSLCTASLCTVEWRFLRYTDEGQPAEDSLIVKTYARTGEVLSETTSVRRYEWSPEGLLRRAEYPAGTYELFYGSQVVWTKAGFPSLSLTIRDGHIWGLTVGERCMLWDLHGRCVWEAEADADGKAALPSFLPQGLYILQNERFQQKLLWQP